MKFQTRIAILAALGLAAMAALADTETAKPPDGYGPGMMGQQLTPEQQQMWEYMHRHGWGPGMMMGPMGWGYGPGMMMGPWGGYGPMMMGPGMMGWGGGYGPGMMGEYGPGMMMGNHYMTPEQYKQWYEQMQQRFNPPAKAPAKPAK